jgi:hypothetical protein
MKLQFDQLFNEAYEKLDVTSDREFRYYTGPERDIMFVDDMDVSNLKRMMDEGKMFKTVYLARREDAVKKGDYPDVSGIMYYVFYTAQDFAQPALIPIIPSL